MGRRRMWRKKLAEEMIANLVCCRSRALSLEPAQPGPQPGGQHHAEQKRLEPVAAAVHQDVVHEHLGEDGDDQPRHHQGQPGQDGEGHAAFAHGEPLAQGAEHARPVAARLEVRAGFDLQGHAGERLVEFLVGDHPGAGGRVVEKDLFALDSLKHHEVVEIPEQDQGQPGRVQMVGLHAVARGLHAVGAGGLEHVACLAPVAVDTAVLAQLLERHELPVVGEHDGERGGPALQRLHLYDGGRLDPFVLPEDLVFGHVSLSLRCRARSFSGRG